MDSLLKYREEIDRIDAQLVQLFEERMKVSEAVARYKIGNGMQVLDADRETQKIRSVMDMASTPFNKMGMKELITQIMAISRKRQYQLMTDQGVMDEDGFEVVPALSLSGSRVVFQGVEGAYSQAAMQAYFGDDITSYHVKTWHDAMEEVKEGRADYAVLPIENSTAGIVSDIYDLLMEYDLVIAGEQVIRVDHVLLGLPGTSLKEIRTVVSHPQGLAQCREFLEAHPGWELVKEANTAAAAKKVSEAGDRQTAAIASRQAGELYGLSVLCTGICANERNVTRFIIVSARKVHTPAAGRVSICFELAHTTGSLYNMLSHIIYNGLNMTRIESRPIPGKTWEYRFFVDFEGNLKDSAVINALRGIRHEANMARILGNY